MKQGKERAAALSRAHQRARQRLKELYPGVYARLMAEERQREGLTGEEGEL